VNTDEPVKSNWSEGFQKSIFDSGETSMYGHWRTNEDTQEEKANEDTQEEKANEDTQEEKGEDEKKQKERKKRPEMTTVSRSKHKEDKDIVL